MVKAKGSFPYCEIDYKDSMVGYAIYERDNGYYPQNPPLTMMTQPGHHQSSGGMLNIPINTGSGESGWFEMYNYIVEESSTWTNSYTDSIDYKLSLFMNGPVKYRGVAPGNTGPWEQIDGIAILMTDVYFSITSDGQPPPPDVLTVLSGPENNNLVSIVGVGSKTSTNGVATFELEKGQYSVTISHEGYDPYQNHDVYVDGPTTLGPISLSGSSGPVYSIVVATIPYADYIDCEGVNNNYFQSSCDEVGIGIFIVPEPGSYKCTAGWDDRDPHEKYKYAYPSDAIPNYTIVIYWSQTSTISSFYILDSIDMDSSYEYNGYYLGSK